MATSTGIPGPTTYRMVDLDAGTTLPRAVTIGVTLLAAAALVATLLAGQPAYSEPTPAPMPKVAPQAITIPAWRAGWGDFPQATGPAARPYGPSALIDASTVLDIPIGR